MQDQYFECLVNREHVVFGRRLHPYCLYDLMFLILDGNPLCSRSFDQVTLSQLESAVLICSTPPVSMLAGRPLFRVPLEARLWHWRCRKMNLEQEVAKFVDYINDYDVRPKFWEEEGKGDGLRAPWLVAMTAFLEDHTNMTEQEIMTAPIGQMFWKSAALAELLGVSSSELMTDDEEEALRIMGKKV